MVGRDWWRAAEAHTGAHWRNENIALNLEGGYRPPFQIPVCNHPPDFRRSGNARAPTCEHSLDEEFILKAAIKCYGKAPNVIVYVGLVISQAPVVPNTQDRFARKAPCINLWIKKKTQYRLIMISKHRTTGTSKASRPSFRQTDRQTDRAQLAPTCFHPTTGRVPPVDDPRKSKRLSCP